jgi:hypothetical protein
MHYLGNRISLRQGDQSGGSRELPHPGLTDVIGAARHIAHTACYILPAILEHLNAAGIAGRHRDAK